MTRHDAETAARLTAYFATRLAAYGHDPRGVDWESTTAQQARFMALLEIGDLDGCSVLDAGCGLGDLYAFLAARGLDVAYTGCDLSLPHIVAARALHPAARFVHGDVRAVVPRERFDYVIACGMLHLRVPRWNRWAWDCVQAMYAGCRHGLAFTLPRRGAGHPPVLATIEPADWLSRLRTLAPAARAVALDPWGDVVFLLPRP
jgi:SAM-dependent methyltransferase